MGRTSLRSGTKTTLLSVHIEKLLIFHINCSRVGGGGGGTLSQLCMKHQNVGDILVLFSVEEYMPSLVWVCACACACACVKVYCVCCVINNYVY